MGIYDENKTIIKVTTILLILMAIAGFISGSSFTDILYLWGLIIGGIFFFGLALGKWQP